jgi:hypothetical protein
MKKYAFLFSVLLCTLLMLQSCSKKNAVDDIISGNGDYFEFSLDGTAYHLEASVINSSDYVQSLTTFQSDTILDNYSFSCSLGHVKNLSDVSPPSSALRITMKSPLTSGNYPLLPFDASNPTDTLIAFTYLNPDSSVFIFNTGDSTSGNIVINKLNSNSGGSTEGTFNFNNVELLDKSGTLISGGHTLTAGKFKATVL